MQKKRKKLLTFEKKWCIIYKSLVNINVKNGTNAARILGSIAQLGEHLPYKQRVIGSSPIVPTKVIRAL